MARKTSSVDKVILAFGGPAAFAEKLGVAPSTVQTWQRRKAFPASRNAEISELAEKAGLDVSFLSGGEQRISPKLGAPADLAVKAGESLPESRLSDAEETVHGKKAILSAKPEDSAPEGAHMSMRRCWQQPVMWVVAAGVFVLAILTASSQFIGVRVQDNRGEALDGQMETLRQQAEAATHAGMESRREIQRLLARLDTLEMQVATLSTMPVDNGAGLAGTVSSVQAEVAQLGNRVNAIRQESQVAEALALALGQLRISAQGSVPFRADVDAAKALALQSPDDPAGRRARLLETLRGLEFHADHGVATVAELRDHFDALAGDVVMEARLPAQGGAAGRALRWVFSTVRIYRAPSEMTGNAPEAIVARIQTRLQRGDLVAAVSEALRLKAASSLLAPWMAQAQARLTVDRTLAGLSRNALLQLVPDSVEIVPEMEDGQNDGREIPVPVAPVPEPVPAEEGGAP
ncbi:MAG TPA: hypothetical protein DCW68_01020 [Rhodospirillaceae bacterium]|nr:MAG: hypothetical protein A2018_00595 [Alphaproteobacteria bacterium GWF2_58_20]HAU28680.1 hypothetical protein [Rhodospirillaceae bacterium]